MSLNVVTDVIKFSRRYVHNVSKGIFSLMLTPQKLLQVAFKQVFGCSCRGKPFALLPTMYFRFLVCEHLCLGLRRIRCGWCILSWDCYKQYMNNIYSNIHHVFCHVYWFQGNTIMTFFIGYFLNKSAVVWWQSRETGKPVVKDRVQFKSDATPGKKVKKARRGKREESRRGTDRKWKEGTRKKSNFIEAVSIYYQFICAIL